jgi:hypothetical protein
MVDDSSKRGISIVMTTRYDIFSVCFHFLHLPTTLISKRQSNSRVLDKQGNGKVLCEQMNILDEQLGLFDQPIEHIHPLWIRCQEMRPEPIEKGLDRTAEAQ